MSSDFQVLVIGGGPGGAAVASLLAKEGLQVALFEKSTFPRFHVGESLVPAVNQTLEKLGVLDRMLASSFPRKQGVQFFSPKGPTKPFYFEEIGVPILDGTWQVLRQDFDCLLLDRARELGVQVFEPSEVKGLVMDGDRVTGLEVIAADGERQTFMAPVVVDASGQSSMLARRFGQRENIEGLQNASVFAHYKAVRRDAGKDAGSTLIYRLDARSWLWYIPLPDDVVSIGLVAPATRFAKMEGSSEDVLSESIAASPDLASRMDRAQRSSDVFAVRDYSYRSKVDGGKGWALVGDALSFIDPMYSTGLLLAMISAEQAAAAISRAVRDGDAAPDLRGFSAEYQEVYEQYLWLVRAFYAEDFHFGQLAKDPIQRRGLVEMLSGVIGTEEGLAVTSRIQEFFAEEEVH